MLGVNSFVIGGALGLLLALAVFLMARRSQRERILRGLLCSFAVLVLVVGVASISFGIWIASGDRSAIAAAEITDGVTYERFILDDAVAHLMSFDLSDPCLSLTTTAVRPDGTVDAQRTTSWASDVGAVAAINSNYFFPYSANLPWEDPTPIEGEEVNILGTVKREDGQAISSVTEFGKIRNRVWVDQDGATGIDLVLPADAEVAVTGRELILDAGQVVGHESENYPRTVVGIAEGTTQMWWLVVDGKRPGYSVGVTFDEAAEYLASRGATDAVALDGGGSSTMVVDDGSGVRMLNATRNQAIPDRERPIANHLGLIRPDSCQ